MRIDLESHTQSLFRFALSLSRDFHLAEDLTQECLLRAHRAKQGLRTEETKKAWLFQIMLNLVRDRARKKTEQPIEAEDLEPVDGCSSPEKQLMLREELERVFRLMQELPDQQRQVLFLSVVEEFSHSEIAELLSISLGAVKTNLSIAKKKLRTRLSTQQVTLP